MVMLWCAREWHGVPCSSPTCGVKNGLSNCTGFFDNLKNPCTAWTTILMCNWGKCVIVLMCTLPIVVSAWLLQCFLLLLCTDLWLHVQAPVWITSYLNCVHSYFKYIEIFTLRKYPYTLFPPVNITEDTTLFFMNSMKTLYAPINLCCMGF